MSDYGKLNFSVAFDPTSAFPLDARCYFTSLEAAQAAAATAEEVGSTNTKYFFGQKILVSENEKETWYVIKRPGVLVAEGLDSMEENAVTLLVDGVNYALDNTSEPTETEEEDTVAVDIN